MTNTGLSYNAERLGLGGGGDMSGSDIYDFVEAADGFAEVFPQHKYNVVSIVAIAAPIL
jgi:H+-transporting ATPase